jgi:coenzyme PQQ biosynthesis probable peptidase PqqF
MPALNHPRPHSETLANGLRVTLRHAPDLKRSAAALRVAAGSHDVPLAWPGLAHFLEHLLFLQTERFPAGQGLMAYVQGHGGQVNARTNERTTDYFFELPAPAFAGGLERLSDMLAHPRMNPDDQQREREVLQAEFVAWSQDATAQQRLALFDGLCATHPLRGFHAGNRDSLPVSQPAFQHALQDFYQRFYQAGQMTLSLAGPQSLEALKALAQSFADAIPAGCTITQQAPAPLMGASHNSYQQVDAHRLHLLFALEALPDSSADALAFLCHWLNSAKPGGLQAGLRDRGWATHLRAAPVYQFAGQALLHIEFTLSADVPSTAIREQLMDWLGFFARQDWTPLSAEYAALLQRQQQVSTALQLARLDNEQLEAGLSEPGAMALKQVLDQIGAVDNFSGEWQLPTPNPFLRADAPVPNAGLIRGQTSAHRGLRTFAQDRSRSRRERSPMQFSNALPDMGAQGAMYLRWRLDAAPCTLLQSGLENDLQALREEARQAGVDFSFSASGNEWLLKMNGLQEPMPTVLEHALKALTKPVADCSPDKPTPIALMPIRQLLKVLPDHCLEPTAHSDDLQQLWSGARWDGLAVGLSAQTQAAMGLALSRIPGTPDSQLTPPSAQSQPQWSTIDTESSEHALLLFCPSPPESLADEAAWRLLAHICQTPFYQRLRVELQLGYAVFSALHQVHGQTGLLLGVQSPNVAPVDLLQHIEQFLDGLPQMIRGIDEVSFIALRQTLADQFASAVLPNAQAAELLWQGKLAGRSSDYLSQLPQAILLVDRPTLIAAAQRLKQAQEGWRCLSNGRCPGSPWQVTK